MSFRCIADEMIKVMEARSRKVNGESCDDMKQELCEVTTTTSNKLNEHVQEKIISTVGKCNCKNEYIVYKM